jgi:hypothetical protein
MKRKIIGILILMLLIVTSLSASGAVNTQNVTCKESSDPLPDLACNGEIVKKWVKSGTTVTGSFTIKNAGDAGSLLDWEIKSIPDFGQNWTFNPSNGQGLTPEDGWVTVEVTFTAPTVEYNSYFGGVITISAVDNSDDFGLVAVNINVGNKAKPNIGPLQHMFEHFTFLLPILKLIFS